MDNGARASDLSHTRQEAESRQAAQPVMLALSTFRHSGKAIELATEKARDAGQLVVVHVVDVNLARYFIGTDIGLYPDLQKRCEKEVLQEHEQQAREKVQSVAETARARGLNVRTYVRRGRFALVCLEIVEQEQPSVIITTRSRRPVWVKRFFGSPVDHLTAHAGRPVIEA